MGRLNFRWAQFARAHGGNVIMIFALSIVPIIAVAGFAIDFSRARTAKVQLTTLLDQAVLAASNLSYNDDPTTLVNNWMDSQISQFGYSADDLTVVVTSSVALNSKSVSATAALDVPTVLMGIVGRDTITVGTAASAIQSIPNLEIAMVLDISSSMRGNRLTSLKSASTEFVVIMITSETEDVTSISVVPFGGTVNIGSSLFNKFVVDETDSSTTIDPTEMQYDIGTSVETSAFRFSAGHECIEVTRNDYDFDLLPNQDRAQVPDFWRWWNNHPWCPEAASAIYLNSNDTSDLKAHLNGMVLSDGTGMDIGALWGLKTLSPSFRGELGGEFADRPLDFDAGNSKKVLIVMTDGAITAQNRPEDYSLGNVHTNRATNREPHVNPFSNQGNRGNMQTTRSRGAASNTSAANSAVGRFKLACEAAKAEEILVFTIGFQIRDGSLPDLILEECATAPSYYYHVEGLDLSATFNSIASTVNALRLTE